MVGFLYPQVSEMMFSADGSPREAEGAGEVPPELGGPEPALREGEEEAAPEGKPFFRDFVLFRHPSDLEAMIDGWGGFRIQHPAKAMLVLANQPPWSEEEPPPVRLNLTKRDYDELYEIRANTARHIPVHGLEPHFEARIPKWFIIYWEIEELGEGFVTMYPPEGPVQLSGPAPDPSIDIQAPPTPGAFGCTMAVELDTSEPIFVSEGTRITTVVADYGGRARPGAPRGRAALRGLAALHQGAPRSATRSCSRRSPSSSVAGSSRSSGTTGPCARRPTGTSLSPMG